MKLVLLALPLLDPELRRAALRFPRLVLGGPCLPDHEHRVADVAHVTHALCEWAMDDYLKPWVCAAPGEVLAAQRVPLAEIVALRWRCGEALALRVIDWLSGADRLLRGARVPRLARGLLHFIDRRLAPRFDAYVRETSASLAQVGAVLEGNQPTGEPEPSKPDCPWRSGRVPVVQVPR